MLQKLIRSNIFILLLFTIYSYSQPVADFFHSASKHYIYGKMNQCEQVLKEGLIKYPSDPKLNALMKELQKQEKEQQNDQNKDQNKNNDNQDKKDKKDQQNQDKKDKKDDKKEEQKKNQPDNKEEQKKQKQQQKPQPQPQKSKEDMKKEEALRLLLQYGDDADDLNKPKKKGVIIKGKKPEKDW